jgi:hypothetical protein
MTVTEADDSDHVVAAFAEDDALTDLERAFAEHGAPDRPPNPSGAWQAPSPRCHVTAILLTRMNLAGSLACGFHRRDRKKNDYTSVSSHA